MRGLATTPSIPDVCSRCLVPGCQYLSVAAHATFLEIQTGLLSPAEGSFSRSSTYIAVVLRSTFRRTDRRESVEVGILSELPRTPIWLQGIDATVTQTVFPRTTLIRTQEFIPSHPVPSLCCRQFGRPEYWQKAPPSGAGLSRPAGGNNRSIRILIAGSCARYQYIINLPRHVFLAWVAIVSHRPHWQHWHARPLSIPA